MFIRRKLIIILAIGIIALILASGCKKQEEKIITGVYSSWNWTPDGRVIFSMITHEILHTGPFQAMGYKHGTSVTKVCIMNNDGTDFKVLHEAPYVYRTEVGAEERRIREERNSRQRAE